MRNALIIGTLVLLVTTRAAAQTHTIVALSHTDNTVYELDPVTGKILHQFTAVNQPHEGIASADGRTFYAAIPNGPHVVILDATTFLEKGRIESPFFRSSREKGITSRLSTTPERAVHPAIYQSRGSSIPPATPRIPSLTAARPPLPPPVG